MIPSSVCTSSHSVVSRTKSASSVRSRRWCVCSDVRGSRNASWGSRGSSRLTRGELVRPAHGLGDELPLATGDAVFSANLANGAFAAFLLGVPDVRFGMLEMAKFRQLASTDATCFPQTMPQFRRSAKRTPTGSDAAYQSLRRLLLSPSANADQLEAMDRNALYGSVGLYLSAMALPNVTEFAQVLVTSPSLWTPPARKDAAQVLVTRATSLVQALLFAVDERISLITDNVGRRAPQSAPGEMSAWVRAVLDGVHQALEAHGSRSATLLPKLTLLTGLLRGIENARAQRKKQSDKQRARAPPFHLRRLSGTLQSEWAASCAQLLQAVSEEKTSRAVHGARLAALAMAAQCVDILPEAQMQLVDDNLWIQSAFPALLDVFGCASNTHSLDGLFADLEEKEGQVVVGEHARCVAWASAVQDHPLYSLAGPISRLLASALQRQSLALNPAQVEQMLGESDMRILVTLQTISAKLDHAWCSSKLAGVEKDGIDPLSHPRTMAVWQVFKTFLFAVTMVLDAVTNAVVERCPSPSETYAPARNAPKLNGWEAMATSNTPAPYLRIMTDVVHVYLPLYFITSSFGLDGFESYRKVFYSALDVLSRDPEACTQLTAALAASVLGNDAPGAQSAQDATFGQRIHTTYFLLVVEQLVSEVPNAMIDHLILPMCRPYLQDTSFQDAFESAHSVILALYTAQSPCTLELTPFYVHLLLRSYPTHLSETQLTTALDTVVASLSDRSDSLAWWCVEQVDQDISHARLGDAQNDRVRVLTHALASLISHVNLVLLRSLLTKVSAQILLLPQGSQARSELVEATFEALGDMNASTREEAMRWWLDKSPTFTLGMPADA